MIMMEEYTGLLKEQYDNIHSILTVYIKSIWQQLIMMMSTQTTLPF